jgi:hypothetical protein
MNPEKEREDVTARVEALEKELLEIDENRASIAGQIEQAQANRRLGGGWADPDWYRRAQGAKRHLGVERREIEQELSHTKKRLRELNNILSRDLFQIAVRDVVDDITLQRIIDRHRELEEARHNGT